MAQNSTNPKPANYWPQQSPIELHQCNSFHVKVPKSYFKCNYNGAPYDGHFEGETGHENFVLGAIPTGKKPPRIRLGGETAQLVKIHFHSPSEHDLDGKDQAGEIHLIHEIIAPQKGSELIVLGVFITEDLAAPNVPMFNTLASQMVAQKCGQDAKLAASIDPRHLLPNTDRWYRYEGSLTSKPYTENVSWLVFVEPLKVSSNDLNLIKAFADQPERETQSINRQLILRNFR